jgi:hypothetical protein
MLRKLILPTLCLATLCGCSPQKDDELLSQFTQHRVALEALVRMASDDHLESLWRTQVSERSDLRAREYGALFDKTGIDGIMRLKRKGESEQTILFVKSPLFSDERKDFVFSESPPAPLLQSLDMNRNNVKPYASYYRHIDGNWYLQFQRMSD